MQYFPRISVVFIVAFGKDLSFSVFFFFSGGVGGGVTCMFVSLFCISVKKWHQYNLEKQFQMRMTQLS